LLHLSITHRIKSSTVLIFTTILTLVIANQTLAQNMNHLNTQKLARTLHPVSVEKSTLSEESGVNAVTREEAEMLFLINQERAKAGLAELMIDPALVRIARSKSLDMAQHHYFGHNSERLGSVYDQLGQAQVSYQFAAENLAGAPNSRIASQSLLANPAHRANLLNPSFGRIGIGIAKGQAYRTLVTQILVN